MAPIHGPMRLHGARRWAVAAAALALSLLCLTPSSATSQPHFEPHPNSHSNPLSDSETVSLGFEFSTHEVPLSFEQGTGEQWQGDGTPGAYRNPRRQALARKQPTPVAPYRLTPPEQIAPVCELPGNTTILLSASNAATITWKGWGTTLGWFANYIGGLPVKGRVRIMDLLFNKTDTNSLGLNIVRYNIGGGFNATYSPQFVTKGPVRYRGMPGFRPDPSKPYLWSADDRQRSILVGAKARGANVLIAFANSPPWWMTVSKDVAGGVGGKSNLQGKFYAPFAEFLADVIGQFQTNWKLTFNYLEPVNEPDTAWKKGNTQEGCAYSQPEYASLVPLVANSLRKRGLTGTKIVGVDATSTATALYSFASPPSVISQLASLHVHAYQTSQKVAKYQYWAMDFSRAAAVAATFGKELHMSEWGPDGADGSDLGIALYMSRIIATTVNIMKVSSWSYWQPIDVDNKWTLIEMGWNATAPFKYNLTKKYHTLRQWTSLVPPGSIPIALQSPSYCFYCTAAFYVPCKKQVVFFVVNQQSKDYPLSVTLDGFQAFNSANPLTFALHRTSKNETALKVKESKSTAKNVKMNALAQALSTVVISNIVSSAAPSPKC